MSRGVRRVLLGGLVGLVGLAALFAAARAGHGAGYVGGLLAFLAAIAGIFGLLMREFDEREHGAAAPSPGARLLSLLVPEEPGQRYVSGGAATVTGVGGLFLASGAAPGSGLYVGGLAVFALAVIHAFLLIRASFDAHHR